MVAGYACGDHSSFGFHLSHQQQRHSMTKYKLEYIWLDGYTPVPNLRGKTQIKEFDSFPDARRTARSGASTAAPPSRPKATAPTAC